MEVLAYDGRGSGCRYAMFLPKIGFSMLICQKSFSFYVESGRCFISDFSDRSVVSLALTSASFNKISNWFIRRLACIDLLQSHFNFAKNTSLCLSFFRSLLDCDNLSIFPRPCWSRRVYESCCGSRGGRGRKLWN